MPTGRSSRTCAALSCHGGAICSGNSMTIANASLEVHNARAGENGGAGNLGDPLGPSVPLLQLRRGRFQAGGELQLEECGMIGRSIPPTSLTS